MWIQTTNPLLILFAIVNKETLFKVTVKNVFQIISEWKLFFTIWPSFAKYIVLSLNSREDRKHNLTLPKIRWVPQHSCAFVSILKGLWRKIEREYRIKLENLRNWRIHIRNLFDVTVSRNWHKIVSKLYQNVYMKDIRDNNTALPLVGALVTCSGRINNIINYIY